MITNSSTQEQIADYLKALNREREGYEARIAAVKAGGQDRLPVEVVEARRKAVDAEIKAAKALFSEVQESDRVKVEIDDDADAAEAEKGGKARS